MNNLLTDKSEDVKMDNEMKRFMSSYKYGLTPKNILLKKYPELNPIVDEIAQEVRREVTNNLQEQFNNLSNAMIETSNNLTEEIKQIRKTAVEAKKEAKQAKEFFKQYWPYIFGALQSCLEYRQSLLDLPYVRYVSTSFAMSAFIEREISKTFGRPKGKMGLVSYYIFMLFFTGIIASYLQSLDWCVFYGKELYPILQTRLRTLTTETFTKLMSEAQIQSQKLGSEKVGIGLALGKTGIEKMKQVFSSLMIMASSYHMAKLSADNVEIDTEIIQNSDNGEEIVDTYKDIKPKFKITDKFVSPTMLMTAGELSKLSEGFTKIELLSSEVALYIGGSKELSVFEPSGIAKAIDLIKQIKNELENPNIKIASRVFGNIQDQMMTINKDIARHVDYNSLSIAAKGIDNNIESNIELINGDINYALNKIGETWNSRTLFLSKGPQINSLIAVPSSNPEISVQEIGIHCIDYMLVFFVLMLPLLTFSTRQIKKVYRKIKGENLPIEVLEQHLRYFSR
jgi:hypothetical protein